jgi:hypothetical protein
MGQKKENMTADERLDYHVAHSKPLLDDLKEWFEKQFEAKDIEPNSSLGAAINYMTERWNKLTLFLRVPGAPLDNESYTYCTSLSESVRSGASCCATWNRYMMDRSPHTRTVSMSPRFTRRSTWDTDVFSLAAIS